MAVKTSRRKRRTDATKIMVKLRRTMRELGIIEPTEWLLALLHASRGRIPSRIHVQKALFIASRYLSRLRESLEFNAYRMGPWSGEANDALENAIINRLITETKEGLVLTKSGYIKAVAAWNKLSPKDRKILADVANFVSIMTEHELLLYVYTSSLST